MTEELFVNITFSMNALRTYCKKWGICELALFGSVLRDDFVPDSDVDVLVQFHKGVRHTLFELVDMADELEVIFGRKIDLLTRNSVEESSNYLRRQAILSSVQVIYAE
jgi:hypothetical protein